MELKQKFRNGLKALREGAVSVVRRHPVELVLLLALTVTMLVYLEREDTPASWVTLLGWSALVQLIVNLLVGQGPWRRIYWVVWLLFVPLALWPGLPEWLTTPQGLVSLLVLTPLALLACRRARENRQFVSDVAVYLRSAVLAMLLAYVAYGLFEAILWSTVVIFGFSSDSDAWVARLSLWLEILNQFFVVPVLFMMMLDRWLHRGVSGGRILEVMLNYIFTPAVVAYAAILYLYLLKILFTWRLPDGGVAYLVFGFTIAALLVKALRELLARRTLDWFYDRFSYLSLPFVALFWVGVARRVGEYGLTEMRVWLLASGAVMSFCVLLFLSRRAGRYLWVVLAAMVTAAMLLYIPPLEPTRLAVRSQTQRAERAAGRLGILTAGGRIDLARFEADTTQRRTCRDLYEALDYLEYRDTLAMGRFGVTPDEFRHAVPFALEEEYVTEVGAGEEECWVTPSSSRRIEGIDRFRTFYADFDYANGSSGGFFVQDMLRLAFGDDRPDFRITGGALMEQMLRRVHLDAASATEEDFEREKDRMLFYEDDDILILFSSACFRRDSVWRLDHVAVDCAMTR